MLSFLLIWFSIMFSSKLNFFFGQFIEASSIIFFFLILCFFCSFLLFSLGFAAMSHAEHLIYSVLNSIIIVLIFFSFSVKNILLFLLMFEGMIFPMIFLMFNFSKDQDKISSIFFMIFFNLVGSIPFMIYALNLNFFLSSCSNLMTSMNMSYFCSSWIFFCFILIFLNKIPVVLFHFWLPKAHGSASGACSMILAALVLKLGTFGIMKYSFSMIKNFISFNSFIFTVSCAGSLIFTMLMYRFFDLKHLIACSSILHMTMIFPSISFNQSMSIFMGILMMVGHGYVSFWLFYLVTLIYEKTQSRSSSSNKSEETKCKTFSMMFFMALFFNLGLPPLINFFSEMGFCSMMVMFSQLTLTIFSVSLISSIFFTILICSSLLYGKKFLKTNLKTSLTDLVSSIFMFLILVSSPLIFFSFSLKMKRYFVEVKF